MTDETLANQADQATDAIVCDLPDDWHLHLRDGEAMQSVVLATALQFGRAIVMPNLKPPVCSVSDALSYLSNCHQLVLLYQPTFTVTIINIS